MAQYCPAAVGTTELMGEPAVPSSVTAPLVGKAEGTICNVPLLTTVLPAKLLAPLNFRTPPPDLFSPPGPVNAPESEILNGVVKESAHWKVILPLRVSRIMGTEETQLDKAPTVPPESTT